MREHTMENEIWDEGQLGAVEGVLGTVDQLIIDRCIMEKLKQYHKNHAAALCYYKRVYDEVHYDWMLIVRWIGIPDEVIKLISSLMELWKTRLEIWMDKHIVWNSSRRQLFTSWFLHLRDTSM